MNSNGKTSMVYYWTLSFFAFHNLKKQKFAYFRVFKFKIIIEPVLFASISKKTSLSKLSLHFASLRYHCHYCPTFQYFLRSLWLQRLVLLLKVSTPQGPSCIWTCLHYRHVPFYCRKCSLRFENNLLNVGHVRFASKIIFFLSNVFATLRK